MIKNIIWVLVVFFNKKKIKNPKSLGNNFSLLFEIKSN